MLRPLTPTGTSCNNYMLDDSGPRPLPRNLNVPLPPSLSEKPRPLVPDVSLIFHQSPSANNGNDQHRRMFPTTSHGPGTTPQQMHFNDRDRYSSPIPSSGNVYDQASHGLLLELISLVKKQATTIERMDGQLQELVKMGHESKALVGPSATALTRTETYTQTDSILFSSTPKTNDERDRSLRPSTSSGSGEFIPPDVTGHGQGQRSSSSNSNSSSPDDIPIKESAGGGSNGNGKPQRDTADPQDLSRILKDLQLPTIQEQSVYSSVSQGSMPYFDMPDYTVYNPTAINNRAKGGGFNMHDASQGLGPSVSQYGSGTDDSEDDENELVQPSPTFYRNILGNVNLLLKNGEPGAGVQNGNGNQLRSTGANAGRRGFDSNSNSDTTMYGMTSNNLSFATREYLERHGLVETQPKPPQPNNGLPHRRLEQLTNEHQRFVPQPQPRTHRTNNGNGNNNINDRNRFLDLSALRNQPKLL